MFYGSSQDEAERLHDRALGHLEAGELDAALGLAQELRRMRWSGAFEIEALVARRRGDLEVALRALAEGRAAAPSAWSLHQLAGIVLGEAGRTDEALAAFEAALGCEGAARGSVRYNRAVLRMRRGEAGLALADAEAALEAAAGAPFALEALGVALEALGRLGRSEDAVSLVRTLRASLAPDDAAGKADLDAFLALALARNGAGAALVREHVARAVDGSSSRAELVLALQAVATGAATSRFRLALAGPAPPGADGAIAGYLRVVEVRAADEAQAIAIALELEPGSLRSSVTVEECRRLGDDAGPPAPLHASGRIWHGG